MDVFKINELLQENEIIKRKINELKKKLNLKNYQGSKQQEIKYTINKLKEVYILNQSRISNLSEIKAGTFAQLVCNILNKTNLRYKVKCVNLNYPQNSKAYRVLQEYNKYTKGRFLVVTNRDIKVSDIVVLDDITLIPIAHIQNQFDTNLVTEYDFAILENKIINIFNNPDLENANFSCLDVRTFTLGNPGEVDKHNNIFSKLKNEIKKELGIFTVKDMQTEKQL